MHPKLESLYESCPRLKQAYIREVLKLDGERAEKVGKINGGIHREEAELLARVVADLNPRDSLEIGLGYGFSALAICASADRPTADRRHLIVDPHQNSYWGGLGLQHLHEAGFAAMIELHEDYSYRVLPRLEAEHKRFDLAFIDGWHTFDFVFVDFFYIDKLLRDDGVVVFDDADWPSVRPVLRFAVSNLDYSVVATLPEKRAREPLDEQLGLEGSCIALRKEPRRREREIFFHEAFC